MSRRRRVLPGQSTSHDSLSKQQETQQQRPQRLEASDDPPEESEEEALQMQAQHLSSSTFGNQMLTADLHAKAKLLPHGRSRTLGVSSTSRTQRPFPFLVVTGRPRSASKDAYRAASMYAKGLNAILATGKFTTGRTAEMGQAAATAVAADSPAISSKENTSDAPDNNLNNVREEMPGNTASGWQTSPQDLRTFAFQQNSGGVIEDVGDLYRYCSDLEPALLHSASSSTNSKPYVPRSARRRPATQHNDDQDDATDVQRFDSSDATSMRSTAEQPKNSQLVGERGSPPQSDNRDSGSARVPDSEADAASDFEEYDDNIEEVPFFECYEDAPSFLARVRELTANLLPTPMGSYSQQIASRGNYQQRQDNGISSQRVGNGTAIPRSDSRRSLASNGSVEQEHIFWIDVDFSCLSEEEFQYLTQLLHLHEVRFWECRSHRHKLTFLGEFCQVTVKDCLVEDRTVTDTKMDIFDNYLFCIVDTLYVIPLITQS